MVYGKFIVRIVEIRHFNIQSVSTSSKMLRFRHVVTVFKCKF